MSATLSPAYLIARGTQTALKYFHVDHLVLIGLLLAIVISDLAFHGVDGSTTARLASPALTATTRGRAGDTDGIRGASMAASMRAALDDVSRRYRVSAQALVPIFETAELAGRERNIDPVLLIAIISIESRFNPYSQSVLGAQGLMQIIPRFHLDKVPAGSGDAPFLDPVTNIRVGAQILQESIRQSGDLMAGLQQYGGAVDDEAQVYANKVMAEKLRLDQVLRRSARTGA